MSTIFISSAPTRTVITLIDPYRISTPCGYIRRRAPKSARKVFDSWPHASQACFGAHFRFVRVCVFTVWLELILSKISENRQEAALRAAQTILNARAGKKKGGWGGWIFARPRFPPPNFVPAKFARPPTIFFF